MQPRLDVAIIGGGPAGSTLGAYLARAGMRVALFEAANHPRPHVGESLVPSTTRVFKELGFLDTMEEAGFVKKYGAAWHPPKGKGVWIEFREFPQEGVDQDYTYHVDRGKFDLLLLKHAERAGCRIFQGTRVKHVNFDQDDFACGITIELGGKSIQIPAQFVVDASGRRTLLGSQLKLKRPDPVFNQFAIHAWFENVNRGEPPIDDYIHIYFLPVERGWVWQIPITSEITSVGVVAERRVFRESQGNIEEWFWHHATSTPPAARAMAQARRINEFKSEGDYSYCMEKFLGNAFLLIGDAARFVDPIFSSGVSVALYSAKFAAEQIQRAFETGDRSERALKPYEEKLRRGVDIWYEFIRLYYKLLPLFTRFILSRTYRHQVLQLLQGEVYDRQEVPVLEAMRRFVREVESRQDHLLRPALSDIPVE